LPVTVFLEKPSKKEYPDYYRIISDPIDMLTIEANIKNEKYNTTDELVKDFQVGL
jgi:protein polybromo-1